MSPNASQGQITVMSVPRPSMPGMSSPNLYRKNIRSAQKTGKKQTSMLKWMFARVCPSYPFWPGLGALLLKVRTVLCLNLGGAFLSAGVATSAIMIGFAGGEK